MNTETNLLSKIDVLKKCEKINNSRCTTINSWLKLQERFTILKKENKNFLCNEDFTVGTLMPPISDDVRNIVPDPTKAYLFHTFRHRFKGIINQNNVSSYNRGKWKTVTRAKHVVYVVSVSVFSDKKLEWLRGPSDTVEKYILPDGYKWDKDNLGIKVVNISTGEDYHPTWNKDITVDKILISFSEQIASRENTKRWFEEIKNKKEQDNENQKRFIDSLNNTFVLFEDSRRVGNCVEGTLKFAEIYLGISREDILNAPFSVKVPASRLYGKNYQANNACFHAWQRETLVSI